MVPGEHNDDPFQASRFQLGGTNRAVRPVPVHRCGHRQAQSIEHGGDGATDRTQPRVALPDVVKQRRGIGLLVARSERRGTLGHVEGVALIGPSLCPEERGALSVQVVPDLLLFRGGEPGRGQVSKKAGGEVPEAGPG
jgi:hypothetical protein